VIEAEVFYNYYESTPSGIPTGIPCDSCGDYSEKYIEINKVNKVYNKNIMDQVKKPINMGYICSTCLTTWLGDLNE